MSWRQSLDVVSRDELRARRAALSELVNPARYDDPLSVEFHRDLETYAIDQLGFGTSAAKSCARPTNGRTASTALRCSMR